MSDDFLPSAAAYALGALDDAERREFEAHLATCAVCQAEVAAHASVAAAIGATTDAITPPASLKARTVARATGGNPRAAAPVIVDRRAPNPLAWALAASLTLAAGASFYAWSLHRELTGLRQVVAQASDESRRLRIELATLRGDSARLLRTVEVTLSGDVRPVSLAGQAAAAGATGRALVSPSRGLVVHAEKLPALAPGRVYQVWVLAPVPVSAGLLTVAADGTASSVVMLPPGLPAVAAVAVTNEPGPAGSPTPTMPVLLVGKL